MKLNRIAITSLITSALVCETVSNDSSMSFDDFAKKYQKKYEKHEYDHRASVYNSNVAKINEINSQGNTYTLGINEFADMTQDEFRSSHFGVSHGQSSLRLGNSKPSSYLGVHNYSGSTLPASVDWTKLGAVTAVKDQGQCGSCYAFSATGALEGRVEIALGTLVPLSEQQIVDCSSSFGDQGCDGGLMDFVFQYVTENGLCSEKDYSYNALVGKCRASTCKPSITAGEVKGYMDVHPDDVKALMEALVAGPVSVAVEADETTFQFYNGGVLTGKCGSNLDHGVLAVGYGTNANGQQYWLVKNSWGPNWGVGGYIYLSRTNGGGAGECGILQQASYPVIEKVAVRNTSLASTTSTEVFTTVEEI